MNITEISNKTLDIIIAHQFTVAWAGEALSEPPRLQWWRTDLVDEDGGGDLLQRIAPRTHKWASLEAVRQAAILADRKARQRMADPDRVRTLYFWGFEIDERIRERIRDLKWSQVTPEKTLELPIPLNAQFDKAKLECTLKQTGREVPYTVQTSGRELKVEMPGDLGQASAMLLGSMLPLADQYPAPFFRV